MTCGDSQAKAVIQNNMRESFRVNVGVRQGDALSVILFNLLLNYIIQKLDIRGNISTKMVQINVYADNVVII